MKSFSNNKTLVSQLAKNGLEFDQQLQRAFELSASNPDVSPEDDGFPDSYLTLALYRLNTVLTRIVDLNESRYNLFHEYKKAPACETNEVIPGSRLCDVLDEAAKLASPGNVIGVGHFLRAIVKLTLDEKAWQYPGMEHGTIHNTFSAETLLIGMGHSAWTDLSKAPEVKRLLKSLDGRDVHDHEYIMTFDRGRAVFRATSALDTYSMGAEERDVRTRTAVLPHFCDNYTGFLPDEILELEDLINHPHAKESDLQDFFERHPQLFRLWEFRDVYPHVYLTREEDGDLVPDFLLADPELQSAMILDLKLPCKKIVVGKKNRRMLSAPVMEAKAQLQTYRDWFADKSNREKVKERFGMEVFHPKLAVVIGRSRDFTSPFERQSVLSRNQELEIVTYDDILEFAKRRLMLIQTASRV